jgi:hypothetical protein
MKVNLYELRKGLNEIIFWFRHIWIVGEAVDP